VCDRRDREDGDDTAADLHGVKRFAEHEEGQQRSDDGIARAHNRAHRDVDKAVGEVEQEVSRTWDKCQEREPEPVSRADRPEGLTAEERDRRHRHRCDQHDAEGVALGVGRHADDALGGKPVAGEGDQRTHRERVTGEVLATRDARPQRDRDDAADRDHSPDDCAPPDALAEQPARHDENERRLERPDDRRHRDTRELERTEEERDVDREEEPSQDAAPQHREAERAPPDEKQRPEENDAQPEPVEGERERSQADLLNEDAGRAPGDGAEYDRSQTRRGTLRSPLVFHSPRPPLAVQPGSSDGTARGSPAQRRLLARALLGCRCGQGMVAFHPGLRSRSSSSGGAIPMARIPASIRAA
jgi:hypothetical protein